MEDTGRDKKSGPYRSLDQEVQCEDADASGDKAAPEDGRGVERGALLYGEQQPPNRSRKRRRHTCQENSAPLSLLHPKLHGCSSNAWGRTP